MNCSSCGRRHNSLFHRSNSQDVTTLEPLPQAPQTKTVTNTINSIKGCRQVLLVTALIKVRARNSQLILLRALFNKEF